MLDEINNTAEHTLESNLREKLNKKELKGFLSLFLVWFVGVGAVASIILNIIVYIKDPSTLTLIDAIFITLYACYGIYVIRNFYTFKPNAVFTGLMYAGIGGILAIMLMCCGEIKMLKRVIWTLIFFIYLLKSEQVKRLFPKEQRSHKKIDLWLPIIWGILYFVAVIIGAIYEIIQEGF